MKRFLPASEAPKVHPSAYVAQGAILIGAVSLGARSSIWPAAVLRGDINKIMVGEDSNIQDGTIIHVADDFPAIIGDRVSVGHRAVIHACQIEDEVLVGMGAIVMDGAVIGARSVIAAGSLVTKNTQVPEGSLVMGSPAKVIRTLTADEQQKNAALAAKYVDISRRYIALAVSGEN